MSGIDVFTATGKPLRSLARVDEPTRGTFRVGAVQQRWHPDPVAHEAALAEGIRAAVAHGAQLVCLQELTLSPYFAIDAEPTPEALASAEAIPDGPTTAFARRMAEETGAYVHASLYERVETDRLRRARLQHGDLRRARRDARRAHAQAAHPRDGRLPRGSLVPAGPAGDGVDAFPVVGVGEARLGFPTCWDQWFPELARAYALAGADAIVYPTAIGSEPDHPKLRHPAAVAAGDRRQRDRERHLHGRDQPLRDGAAADLLRLVASSPTPTAGSSCRRRATAPRCSSPTSSSTSAATGSTSSRSSRTRRPDAYSSLVKRPEE